MPDAATTFTVDAQISPDDRAQCEDLLMRWMAALNSYDAAAMDALMHFPHVRMAGGTATVYQHGGGNPMDLFERLRRQDGWHHSAWDEMELIQSSPVKAHYALRYTRYREDGSVIGVYDSLYVLSLRDGAWKIQSRSSFGP
ncbi:hypothetical protein IC762_13345 [Bradyrhizobium genosp. L]|uniref:hypothetical protein n=1 Tax=Bradyrhizobium genosp. L TaxID=83637 RepID=UPI0018A2BD99|nr:hypothetical protein [Bradyrhizobium genosp. L]QPF87208.1 hypothetical protein IC762_13345 [Bradyrhizobium genosp. L]